jgi:YfiH family protein
MKNLQRREELRALASLSDIAFMNQSHSNTVVEVSDASEVIDADALVTTSKGLGIAVIAADCLPILLSSPQAVAAVHAGRVGVGNGIIDRTVALMQSLGARGISATVGPSICADCYEVSPQMYQEFVLENPEASTSAQKHALDLKRSARAQLEKLGVVTRDVDICTLENHDYFSFRRDRTPERLAGVIAL